MKLYFTIAMAAMVFAGCTASDAGPDVEKGVVTIPAQGQEPDPTNDEVHATPSERPARGERPEKGATPVDGERPARGDRPMNRPGQPRPIPKVAIDACSGQAVGNACSFSLPKGDLSGSCIALPMDETKTVCRPERPARP